ncbi:lycopene cyclase family protein [uncultured Polaribacter sp.]|uniref:lycopene cyclase family protein n=1 Tax=uncultured Polaribacter sp. TaxID=174711 RepID=UPI0026098358|nr:lycopene cyclase family protein [uncultured Polaribacter sp.]
MKYDYIIAGAGCAGLSLLYGLLSDEQLQHKKILLIDKDTKKSNDRTWCFWEKEAGIFESIVHYQWKKLEFLTTDFETKFDLKQYKYKMIRGLDFYNHVLKLASKFTNVTFLNEDISAINADEKSAKVKTSKKVYTSKYVFNSTALFNPKITTKNSLLQHFKGWVIKTKTPVFNKEVGTLMDFRVHQNQGATFMYVLPTSSTEALIEYTLFSKAVLKEAAYVTELKNYIKNTLKIDEYEILHQEFGVIPMSLSKFTRQPKASKNIVNIGTAGGFTKASSGYTFQFIQKNTKAIIKNLREDKIPLKKISFREKMYHWYDKTLLDVLLSHKLQGKEVFSIMFKKLPPEVILAFLGNESTFLEELRIMNAVPIKAFLTSGLKQLK